MPVDGSPRGTPDERRPRRLLEASTEPLVTPTPVVVEVEYWIQRRLGTGARLALLVDAAVLALTERLGEPKLATLDRRHFGTLRPRHVDALNLLPLDQA